MRRIRIKFEKVTSSPLQASEVKVATVFGKPAKVRHRSNYDDFKGVKVPKNIGVCIMGDLCQLLPIK